MKALGAVALAMVGLLAAVWQVRAEGRLMNVWMWAAVVGGSARAFSCTELRDGKIVRHGQHSSVRTMSRASR